MVALRVHKDFQSVRKLPFCYLCGKEFLKTDKINADHVPPETAFNPRDRSPVLKLKTHQECHRALSVEDKKVGQLIALRRFQGPTSARDRALALVNYTQRDMVALENLNVDAAVWRWVRGFHAALYRQPLLGASFAITTPFPRGEKRPDGHVVIRPIPAQHLLAVEAIKRNRLIGEIDTIVSNAGQLKYECVWCEADGGGQWLCMFAIDLYDWKDLGSHTAEIPARGCAGIYALPDRAAPAGAARDRKTPIAIANIDRLDPFAP